MEKIIENKYVIGAVIFYALFILVGGLMTRNVESYIDINNQINLSF